MPNLHVSMRNKKAALQVLVLVASLVTCISAYRPEDETSLIQVELRAATAKVANSEHMAPLAELSHTQSRPSPCDAVIPNIPKYGKQPVLDAVKKCGELEKLCPDLDVIKANTDYPMTNKGEQAIIEGRSYIVQWDMYLDTNGKVVEDKESGTNTCIEMVSTGFSNWGTMGIPDVKFSFNHNGKCGRSDSVVSQLSHALWGASKDCMKHDVCRAMLMFFRANDDGTLDASKQDKLFCDCIHCGDEAAQAIWNCQDCAWELNDGPKTNIECPEDGNACGSNILGKENSTGGLLGLIGRGVDPEDCAQFRNTNGIPPKIEACAKTKCTNRLPAAGEIKDGMTPSKGLSDRDLGEEENAQEEHLAQGEEENAQEERAI